MKLRVGFVTNSSSTSYVFAYKGEPNLREFLSACGVEEDSPAERIFSVLFDALINNSEPIRSSNWRRQVGESFEQYVENRFSPGVLTKVNSLESQGYRVLVGTLRSDDEAILSQLCVNHFLVEADGVYLHALDCCW